MKEIELNPTDVSEEAYRAYQDSDYTLTEGEEAGEVRFYIGNVSKCNYCGSAFNRCQIEQMLLEY